MDPTPSGAPPWRVMCRRHGGAWIVAIVFAGPSWPVQADQGGVPLAEAAGFPGAGAFRLRRLTEPVRVVTGGGAERIPAVAPEGWLLCRLSGDGLTGEQADLNSVGPDADLVVFLPEGSRLVGGCLRSRPQEADAVGLGLVAREVALDERQASRDQVHVVGRDGRSSPLLPFHLTGPRIEDDLAESGPLFGPDPPLLQAVPERWAHVAAIEVARSARDEWGAKRAIPAGTSGAQPLWPRGAEPRSGSYVVRLWGHSGTAVASLRFRLARGLHGLAVGGAEAWPGPQGHAPARITFHHTGGLTLQAAPAWPSQPAPCPGGTEVAVPPSRHVFLHPWTLRMSDGGTVPVAVEVPRVWWRVRAGPADESPWTDRCLALQWDEIERKASYRLQFRAPPAWNGRILRVGAAGAPDCEQVSVRQGGGAEVLLQPLLARWVGGPWRDASVLKLQASADGVAGSSAVLAVRRALWYCALGCGFRARARMAVIRHLVDAHGEDLLVPAGVAARQPAGDGPVYQCLYCGYRVAGGNAGGRSRTSVILAHLERWHARDATAFRVLPSRAMDRAAWATAVRQCRRCGYVFGGADPAGVAVELQDHIEDQHPDLCRDSA